MSNGSVSISRFAPVTVLTFLLLSIGVQGYSATASHTTWKAEDREKTGGIDAARAYEHVKRLVALGPRPSGSAAIKRAQAYISGELKGYGLQVREYDFVGETPKGRIRMKNIVGELAGDSPDIIMISGHYDTKRQLGFVGANDGGSSTAAVLEMARVLSKTRPRHTLWFVFFDGEEAVVDWSANNGEDNTYGSRYLAQRFAKDGTINRIKAMILVDMIGDKGLDFRRDQESTPWMVDLIWETARRLGYESHFLDEQTSMSDDHLAFRDAGVPVVDIIDFNFGPDNSYWHTTRDSLDKVSGESIKVVGDVVIQAIPELSKRLEAKPKVNGNR